uniref:Exonuclease domain-containing protein n=1 Tax=Panagrolaimus superbus TaxID=310955 RepID=A0A914Z6T8_9BILA
MIPLRPDQVHTLIFMDFETTGMIPGNIENSRPTPGDKSRSIAHMVTRNCNVHDNPSEMPQITEMAFVSVPRQLFASAVEDIHAEAIFDEDGPLLKKIPSNIYVSQIKPNLTFNQWKQYEETQRHCSAMHLSQMDLKYKNSFVVEWPAVHAFLKNQKPPAIIIAHNGANFDFRVLYSELVKNKLLEKYPLPDGMYFMDSYLAFLDIEKQHLDNLAVTTSLINWEKVDGVMGLAKRTSIIEEEVEVNSNVAEAATNAAGTIKNDNNVVDIVEDSMDIFQTDDISMEPQTSATSLLRPPMDGMRTPPQKRKVPVGSQSVDSGLKRKTSETNWEFNKIGAREYFFKGNFKLESLYKQISKSSYDAHHALDDCHALMQVSLAYGEDFINYMENRKEKIPLFYAKRFPTPVAPRRITPTPAEATITVNENFENST